MSNDETTNGNQGHSKVDVLDVNYPLMVFFKKTASGTHSHNRTVGTIVESIARALDFEPERTQDLKIAGAYHDIGKTSQPSIFTENQQEDSDSPLDALDPAVSFQLLAAHVGETCHILINDPNFPRHVIEWISQHHGNSQQKFFHHKALKALTSKGVSDKEAREQLGNTFRYKTSNPSSLASSGETIKMTM